MRSLSTRTTGLLILALGVWGGLVPFVGHYFHFALGPDKAWTWTSGRLYLSVIPGAVAVLAGLFLIGAGPHGSARLAALMALAAGIWFAIGPDVSLLWNSAGAQGPAHGSKLIRVLEMVTYHTGLGAVIAFLAGYALPRFPLARDAAETAGAAGATGVAARGAGRRREPLRASGRTPGSAPRGRVRSAGAGAGAGAAASDYERDYPTAATRQRESEPIRQYEGEFPTEATTPDDREYPAESPAAAGREQPATEPPPPAEHEPATTQDAPTTQQGDVPAATTPPPDGGTGEPAATGAPGASGERQVVKRRKGGLLSAFRRR